MTKRDQIYKDFQNGGDAWATLSEDIHSFFTSFLDKNNFAEKKVLDIGCGTGKYLKYLEGRGFETNGVDSSPTAVKMTKEILSDNADIVCKNMFEISCEENKFDLIISISTIHHGTKSQVSELIQKFKNCLNDGGKICITLPDFEINKSKGTRKNDKELEEGTYAPIDGPEKGLPHSFFKKDEIEKIFEKYTILDIKTDEIGRQWIFAEK